jgi:Tfp pilus tip-associated adhesin PilY1
VVDGFIDRVYFGDSTGRVWKLDPTANQGTFKAALGPGVNAGLQQRPLLSTKHTPHALGFERAILGTVAVAPDASCHLALHFGTANPDGSNATEANAVYAVRSHTGDIRSAFDAAAGLAAGTKFTGGVVLNDS